jgi:hypothetical protein
VQRDDRRIGIVSSSVNSASSLFSFAFTEIDTAPYGGATEKVSFRWADVGLTNVQSARESISRCWWTFKQDDCANYIAGH